MGDLPVRENVSPGTWFARDNVYNFIKFCRLLQVMEVVMFETEDLVSQKNEKHVVLTLLEGARLECLLPCLSSLNKRLTKSLRERKWRGRSWRRRSERGCGKSRRKKRRGRKRSERKGRGKGR